MFSNKSIIAIFALILSAVLGLNASLALAQAIDYGDAPKDMSSIDAALTNAYPTLQVDNGARHNITSIVLGSLIDTETDGQPNLAANGDDLNTSDDEDGVAFNPPLGITSANVILSGVQNTLVVTASASGYLSAWIDYNQNGTFTDVGEQIFNDQAVVAAANTLNFTTPDTAPHGATYMRFRYSTQRVVANTVTGLAPDGEVEDYRVEVALPAPQTCDADLVNGSFETPGSGLVPSAEVPGWGFQAINPASGADFGQRHVIEIWSNGQEGVPAYEGSQFAEINGYVPGALYQEMITVPGQTMLWQFAHRGRRGTDVMALKIGPPGATVEVTRATDGTSAWGLYTGSYTVPAGQTITRFEFEAISSVGGDSLGNFIDAVHFSLPCDFGDAPDSYRTSKTANGANHLITDLLRLGALIDAEGTGFPGANADGDNTNNLNDEDSLAPLAPMNQANTAYTLSAIPVLNNTGNAATLYGWIDFNRNGQFDAGEGTSTGVPSSAASQAITLSWAGISGLVAGQSYVRLRLSNQSSLSATGSGGTGEVEDYPLTVTPSGTLVVVKNALNGNGSFDFTSSQLGAFNLATAGGTAQHTFANLLPGTYNVSETAQAGWDLSSATCSDGSNPASIDISAGETATCTFVNTKRGSLTIVKNTLYGDGTFNFNSQALGAFSLTTTNGTAQQTFSNLAPGAYDVSETVPNGWRLDSATCSDGSNPASVNLAAGEDVTCTFQDTKQNSIIAIKATVGGDGAFDFVSRSLGNFTLTTVNGQAQRSFDNLPSGTYDLSETVPTGWTLSSATCSDGSSPSSIQLSPGETVACVFIDLKQDTIVVEKRTQGGDGAFPFTSSNPQIGAFTLTTSNGVASRSFTGLQAGTYNLSETVPAGWRQTGATCDNGNSPSNIQLAPGQTVKCTFENEKQDTIIVVKRAVGGDGAFPFTSTTLGDFTLVTKKGEAKQSFTNLTPGIYDLSETVPAGWTQSGTPTCSDGSPVNRIDLRAGETVVCVFVNLKQDTIVVEKRTQGGDGAFAFTSPNPQIGGFTLTTSSGTASQSFTGLPAGTYAVSETVPAGWRQTGATCDNGDAPNSVQLAPGQTVKCTFDNEKQDTIIVVKRAVGGDGTFPFVSQTLGNFNLKTVKGEAQRSFGNLAPGIYDLSETVPTGWTQSGTPTCSDGSDPANIQLSAGEAVTCTFENTKQDTITVVKRAVGGDGAFDFVSRSLGDFALTTTNGEAQNSFGNLAPGTYDLSETVPAGWNLSTATCSDGSSPASIQLSPGEAVTCTFTNLRQNSIVVEQQTQGGDGTFAFASPQLGAFSLTTRSGVASQAFAALPAGLYAIGQTLPSGWTSVSATCDNGDPPDRINLGSGQSVKCTFVSQSRSVPPSDIPALSEWGLLLLAALLALGAWRRGSIQLSGRQ